MNYKEAIDYCLPIVGHLFGSINENDFNNLPEAARNEWVKYALSFKGSSQEFGEYFYNTIK